LEQTINCFCKKIGKGLFIKAFAVREKEGFISGILRKEGFSDAESELFVVKYLNFFENYGILNEKRNRVETMRIFFGQVGQFFAFCADVFYEWLASVKSWRPLNAKSHSSLHLPLPD